MFLSVYSCMTFLMFIPSDLRSLTGAFILIGVEKHQKKAKKLPYGKIASLKPNKLNYMNSILYLDINLSSYAWLVGFAVHIWVISHMET